MTLDYLARSPTSPRVASFASILCDFRREPNVINRRLIQTGAKQRAVGALSIFPLAAKHNKNGTPDAASTKPIELIDYLVD